MMVKANTIIFILSALLFQACELSTKFYDNSANPLVKNYNINICYAVSDSNKKSGDFGLYVYNNKISTIQGKINNPITGISQIAENNYFTITKEGKPFLGNTNGSLVEITMPITNDNLKEYYYITPSVLITPDGNKIIYFVGYDFKNSHTDTTSEYSLVIHDMVDKNDEIYSMKTYYDKLRNGFPGAHGRPSGKYLVSDYNGQNIYFITEMFYYDKKKYFLSSSVTKFNNDFSLVSTKSNTHEINLIGINHNTERIFVEFYGDIYKFENSDFVNTGLKYANLNNPFQFTYFTDELVLSDVNGIKVINPETYETVVDLIRFKKIDSLFGEHEPKPTQAIAFSPDRLYISFALKNKVTGRYDLFLISKAGKVIDLIAKNLPYGTISIFSKAN
jgi:hypothetical protein